MERNVAGKWIVFAYGLEGHASPGQPVTGDASNITARIRANGGTAAIVADVNPTELGEGYYIFDLTPVETNGEMLSLHPTSSTANVQVLGVPGVVWTRPQNFNMLGIEADGSLSDTAISAGTANQIADAILSRDFSQVSAPAARSALNALRFLRNKWSVTGNTLTITAEDDATAAWTAQVTSSASAEPITGSSPV